MFEKSSDLHWEFFWGDHYLEQFILIVKVQNYFWNKILSRDLINTMEQLKCRFGTNNWDEKPTETS